MAERTDTPAAVERHLEEHYGTLERQTSAAEFGMWVFLGSEVLFFGGLFALYASYRTAYPHAFAEAATHTDLVLGTLMTVVLLAASFLVALAVGAIRAGLARRAWRLVAAAAVVGVGFLGIKAFEWWKHLAEGLRPGSLYDPPASAPSGPGAEAFFTLYYLMTGLHFLHVTVGVGILAWVAWQARREAYDRHYHTPLELGGMYWHFVDVVWLFLWPIFYLLR